MITNVKDFFKHFFKRKVCVIKAPMKDNYNTKAKRELERAVDVLGGVTKVAKLLEIDHSNVSRWLIGKRPLPINHALHIEKLTKGAVKAKDLRPDIADYLS